MNAGVATSAVEPIEVLGAFDLAAAARFRPDPAASVPGYEPGTLCLAFPLEGTWQHTGAVVKQRAPDAVDVEVDVGDDAPLGQARAVAQQVRRILSLDVDARGFPAATEADPIADGLRARYPGVRPVLFCSAYEAACWAVICHRLRSSQAAVIKQWLAERHGEPVTVGGRVLASFPAPEQLAKLDDVSGLSEQKVKRLVSVAEAALDGELVAALAVDLHCHGHGIVHQ